MNIPQSLQKLVDELSRLPGIGQKTAQRLAFSILRDDGDKARNLADAVLAVKTKIRFCSLCYGYAEAELCDISNDPRRDDSLLCIVEQPDNIYVIERSAVFRGRYHVLMGTISPLDGIGPDNLKINELIARLDEKPVREVIIATNPSMQGEATALHLSKVLASRVQRITLLARGLPVGATLEFTDDVTLHQAFAGRQNFLP